MIKQYALVIYLRLIKLWILLFYLCNLRKRPIFLIISLLFSSFIKFNPSDSLSNVHICWSTLVVLQFYDLLFIIKFNTFRFAYWTNAPIFITVRSCFFLFQVLYVIDYVLLIFILELMKNDPATRQDLFFITQEHCFIKDDFHIELMLRFFKFRIFI